MENKTTPYQFKYGRTHVDGVLVIFKKADDFDYEKNKGARELLFEIYNNDVEFARYVCAALNHRHNFFVAHKSEFLPAESELSDFYRTELLKDDAKPPKKKGFFNWPKA